jgi:hypothetical protein
VPRPRRPRHRSKWTGAVTGVAAVAVLVGGTLTVRFLADDGHGGPPAAGKLAGDATRPAVASLSGPPSPQPVSSTSKRPAPRASSSRPAPAASHSSATPGSAPKQSAPPPPTGTSSTCANPQYQTSDPNGGWTDGSYYVTQDMWNASGYTVQQTLYACSYSDWYVVANMNNDSGDGAVKTYPNVHEDFNEKAISSFHSITSTFAEHSPHTGIHEDAYDIWLNGVGSSGSTEVMVWNDNYNQVPSGSVQASVTFSGRGYKVYKSGSYVAAVADSNFTSGTVDLLGIFKWIISKGWIPSSSTVGQIDYGVELVSTSSAPATFTFSDFSISTS